MGPIVYMASTKLFVGALGMGLAFAPSALYPYYVHHARVWGISADDDQSIAGLIMAVEQSLVMGIALVVLFVARAHRVRARAAARRALSAGRSRARAGLSSARAAQALEDAAVAGDRADQDRLRRRSRCRGTRCCCAAARRRRSLAPSPSTIGPISRTPRADLHVAARSTPGLRSRCPRAAASAPRRRSRRGSPPRPRISRRSSPRSASKVPWRSSDSEPTSFQYSRTSWMWKGTSFSSSTGKTSCAQSTNGRSGK